MTRLFLNNLFVNDVNLISVIPSISATNANVSISYSTLGGCNSSILVRIGKYIAKKSLFVN